VPLLQRNGKISTLASPELKVKSKFFEKYGVEKHELSNVKYK
jgi:hypothetical protein